MPSGWTNFTNMFGICLYHMSIANSSRDDKLSERVKKSRKKMGPSRQYFNVSSVRVSVCNTCDVTSAIAHDQLRAVSNLRENTQDDCDVIVMSTT